jgi:hypothetical protein
VLATGQIGPHHDTYKVVVTCVGIKRSEPAYFASLFCYPNVIWSPTPDAADVKRAGYDVVAHCGGGGRPNWPSSRRIQGCGHKYR